MSHEQPEQDRRDSRGCESGRGRRPIAGEAALGQRRALADSGDRLDPRRPQSRSQRGHHGDEDADAEGHDHRAGLDDDAAVGERQPDGVEQREQPLGQAEAREQADDRRDDAERERLEHDRAQHLPPRGSERPQRRELPGPLSDRDRQRIGDHEAADEQRDPREHEQEGVEEGEERGGRVGCLLGLLGAGADLRPGREDRSDLVHQPLRADPRLRGDADVVELDRPCRTAAGRW